MLGGEGLQMGALRSEGLSWERSIAGAAPCTLRVRDVGGTRPPRLVEAGLPSPR